MKGATAMAFALIAALVVSTVEGARAQEPEAPQRPPSYSDYLRERLLSEYKKQLLTDAGIRDPSNQVEVPTTFENATSLIDTSSAADLFSVALNLAQLTWVDAGDGGEDATTFSGNATAWAFYSALEGIDPLAPANYCSAAGQVARRVSLALGHEAGEDGLGDATLIGVKVGLGEDTCKADLSGLDGSMSATTGAIGEITKNVRPKLAAEFSIPESKVNESYMAADGDAFRARAQALTEEQIALHAQPFQNLASDVATTVRALEQQAGYALQFDARLRDGTNDAYTAKLIYERGFGALRGVKFTANGAGEIVTKDDEQDAYGGKLGLGLRWQGRDPDLRGRRPLQLSVSADANWLANDGDTYRANAKLVLPVLEGVEIPISVTVANRTELVSENDVRGLVGFTVDTTQLLAAFGRTRAAPAQSASPGTN
jgi:hypothetical protein